MTAAAAAAATAVTAAAACERKKRPSATDHCADVEVWTAPLRTIRLSHKAQSACVTSMVELMAVEARVHNNWQLERLALLTTGAHARKPVD